MFPACIGQACRVKSCPAAFGILEHSEHLEMSWLLGPYLQPSSLQQQNLRHFSYIGMLLLLQQRARRSTLPVWGWAGGNVGENLPVTVATCCRVLSSCVKHHIAGS